MKTLFRALLVAVIVFILTIFSVIIYNVFEHFGYITGFLVTVFLAIIWIVGMIIYRILRNIIREINKI